MISDMAFDVEYEYPDEEEETMPCEECGKPMHKIVDNNYGADRDGNRGMYMEWWECDDCG